MNKNLKKLLACAMLTFAYSGTARAESTVVGKDVGLTQVHLPVFTRESLALGSGNASVKDENQNRDEAFGGCVEAMIAYDGMTDETFGGAKKLGQAFGLGGLNSIVVQDAKAAVLANGASVQNIISLWYPRGTEDATTFNPFKNGGGSYGSQTVTFTPKIKRWAMDLAYCHDLSNFYDGLYFGVSTTILWQENKLNYKFASDSTSIKTSTDTAGFTALANSNHGEVTSALGGVGVTDLAKLYNGVTVEEFFTGKGKASEHAWNPQAVLKAGVFSDAATSDLAADGITAFMALKLINSENFKACFRGIGFLPLGNNLKHSKLFEASVGEKNFKLGLGAKGLACLAEGADYKASLEMYAQWLYAFGRSGKGKILPTGAKTGLSQYSLVVPAVLGTNSSDIPAPLVNFLLEDAKDTYTHKLLPGHHASVNGALVFEKGAFNLGLSYAFSWQAETKNEVTSSSGATGAEYYLWSDRYTKAAYTSKDSKNTYSSTTATKVVATDLNYNTDSVSAHSLNANVGVTFREWQNPAFVSMFVGYTFNPNTARVPRFFSIGLRGGVCF